MTERWFATHAAGFGDLAARLAARDLPGAAVERDGDNALLIRAPGDAGAPAALLPYCRSLFRVLGEESGGLEAAGRAFVKGQSRLDFSGRGGRASGGGSRTFVLRSFGPDDPAALPPALRGALESSIARGTGLRPDSAHPGREYRLQERSDGRVLLLQRVGSKPESAGRAGELPRTTCRLLAEMSAPQADDVFLDPFCGFGGIAFERALAAPYRFIFAQDLDSDKVAMVKEGLAAKAFEKRRRTFFPKARDALDPTAFDAGFVTAIATDPPWGLYEGGETDAVGAEVLLGAFISCAARILAPGGRLVLLVSRAMGERLAAGARRPSAAAAPGAAGRDFALRERFDVLVSGRKASAIRLDRA